MAVNIFFKTNAKDTVKDLGAVGDKIKQIQKESAIKQGIANLQGKIAESPLGGTPVGDTLNAFTGKLGAVTKLLNPWALAIGAATAAATALHEYAQKAIENGMQASNQAEKTNARLAGQLSAKGVISSEPVTQGLLKMQENGVASIEHLTDTFARLIPVLHGNSQEALTWVERLADTEAATGIGADGLAALLMRIEQTGELEDKTAKKLEKSGIPIWRELAKVYATDIDGVKSLSKAHKLGVAEIKKALMSATKMYEGTAAALSATTEGSKASMEAAKELAFKGAADAYNDKMREFYQAKQAAFDEKQGDIDWQQDLRIIGEAEAELELLWQSITAISAKIGNGALQALGNLIDYFKRYTTAGEIEERRIGRGGEDLARLEQNMGNFDAATARNAFEELYNTLGQENKKLEEYTENWENSAAEERDQWWKVIKAQQAYIDAIKKTEHSLYELSKQQEQAQEDEAARAARAKNYGENVKLQEGAALAGKDQNGIAAAYLFSSAGELVGVYDELAAKIKQHVSLTDEEIELYKELEKPYTAIMKLRQEEAAAYAKSVQEQKTLDNALVDTAAALRAEDERHMMNGEALRRQYGESDTYNKAYDTLKALADKLNSSDLSSAEKEGIFSKELARLISDARQSAVRATAETLEAKGLHSVKDFKYTDFEVDNKMLKTQQDIAKASEDANKLLDTIANKLPLPTMAQ